MMRSMPVASDAVSSRRSYTLPVSSDAGVLPLDKQITKCLEVALDFVFDFADAMSFVPVNFCVKDCAGFEPYPCHSLFLEPVTLAVHAFKVPHLADATPLGNGLNVEQGAEP